MGETKKVVIDEVVKSKLLESMDDRKSLQLIEIFTSLKLPEKGWKDEDIVDLLKSLGELDKAGCPNFNYCSSLIDEKHFGLRPEGCNTLMKLEPESKGSKLIHQLANSMLLDILQQYGAPSTKACAITPVATGMSLMYCLSLLRFKRKPAEYVIWSRIDQKSCFKSISTAVCTPIVVNCIIDNEKLITDVKSIEEKIKELNPSNIVAVMTTTSCFAPRAPDNIEAIGRICEKHDIPHIVNNAYGIQCPEYLQLIEEASKHRVDYYVSSTDKNFMVPVGGGIIASFSENSINEVCEWIGSPGSQVPVTDLFITFLNWGKTGYAKAIKNRAKMWKYMTERLTNLAGEFNEKVLSCPENIVSMGFSLNQFQSLDRALTSEIGSMLFKRNVTGARVVAPGDTKTIEGHNFKNWGSHTNNYENVYLNSAATIGMKKEDVDLFVKRFRKILSEMQKHLVNT